MSQHPKKHFWIFMALAFAITWSFCAAYWLTRSGVEAKPGVFMRLGNLAAVWAPSIAGLLMAWIVGGKENAWNLFARLWRWPGHWKWYALAFAIPLVLQAIGAFIGDLTTPYDFLKAIPDSLAVFAFSAFFSFISGPLGEEWGWRGFALETGAEAYGPLTATAIIGAAWSLWHLPAFIVPGLQDIIFPIGISFWEFSGFTLFGAVIISWLVFNARGAIAPAVIAHFLILMVVTAVDQTPPVRLSLITVALYALAAGFIMWRSPDLGYQTYKQQKAKQ